MAVARWTPMGNLASFQDEMNRLFNQFFRGGNGGEASWGHYPWAPPVDIYEPEMPWSCRPSCPVSPQMRSALRSTKTS
jgi:hypothetical protein